MAGQLLHGQATVMFVKCVGDGYVEMSSFFGTRFCYSPYGPQLFFMKFVNISFLHMQ